MKKIVLYVLVLIILTFTIPFVFTKVSVESNSLNIINQSNNENVSIDKQSVDTTPYNYNEYNTIKLLHTKTNTIEELPLDEYLYRSCFC